MCVGLFSHHHCVTFLRYIFWWCVIESLHCTDIEVINTCEKHTVYWWRTSNIVPVIGATTPPLGTAASMVSLMNRGCCLETWKCSSWRKGIIQLVVRDIGIKNRNRLQLPEWPNSPRDPLTKTLWHFQTENILFITLRFQLASASIKLMNKFCRPHAYRSYWPIYQIKNVFKM